MKPGVFTVGHMVVRHQRPRLYCAQKCKLAADARRQLDSTHGSGDGEHLNSATSMGTQAESAAEPLVQDKTEQGVTCII